MYSNELIFNLFISLGSRKQNLQHQGETETESPRRRTEYIGLTEEKKKDGSFASKMTLLVVYFSKLLLGDLGEEHTENITAR